MLIIMIILPTNWIQAPCHGQLSARSLNFRIVLTTNTRHIHPYEQTLSVSVVSDISIWRSPYEEKVQPPGAMAVA